MPKAHFKNTVTITTTANNSNYYYYNNNNNNEAITCISIKMGTWIRLFVTQLITQKSNKNQK